jgi:HAD superfamily hydrolase (TIGR01549 family)
MIGNAPVRAILLDVGGPMVDEREDNVHTVRVVCGILTEHLGREVREDEIEKARDAAIASWAPSFTKAVLWEFLKPDRERTLAAYDEALSRIFSYREELRLMDGVAELVPKLATRYTLALAANQPAVVKEKLERTGLMTYFKSSALSDDLGLSKPDTRFFLAICDRIGVPPEECCMIGDRLDNDIYPANILGMRTIWVRIGPHAVQRPRIPEDVPDAEVEHMSEVLAVLDRWEKK